MYIVFVKVVLYFTMIAGRYVSSKIGYKVASSNSEGQGTFEKSAFFFGWLEFEVWLSLETFELAEGLCEDEGSIVSNFNFFKQVDFR